MRRVGYSALVSALAACATPVTAKPEAGTAGGSGNPVICKREVPIGSLIASRKICMNKSEWDARATRGNEEARRQMDENAARNPTPSN